MVFRAGLLDPEQVLTHQKACKVNEPFPHCIVSEAIDDDLLRHAKDEIDAHLPLKLDENQLYRVRRSTDLANLSNSEEFPPGLFSHLIKLRDAIYGQSFRQWISQVTGSGPLSGKRSSMTVNLYTPGGHLLAHDDCNPKSRDRRVSFIIYVTDPDIAWKAEWGGALKLFAAEAGAAETAGDTGPQSETEMHDYWSRVIPPCFNQLVFFAIHPGKTYHEVEEVYYSGNNSVDETRRRMTISGWFHAAQEGEEGFKAAEFEVEKQNFENDFRLRSSRRTLHLPQPVFRGFHHPETRDLVDADDTSMISPADMSFLSHYLAPEVLSQDNYQTGSRPFDETRVLQFQPFLREEFAHDLEHSMMCLDRAEDLVDEHEPVSVRWKHAGPPDAHRYLYLESLTTSPPELVTIATLLERVLKSCPFRTWLARTTGHSITSIGDQYTILRRFRRGSDYILESEYGKINPRLDYTLDISPVACDIDARAHENRSGLITTIPSHIHQVDMDSVGGSLDRPRVLELGQRKSLSWNRFTVATQNGNMQHPVDYMTRAATGDRWDIRGQICLSSQRHLT